MIPKIHQALDEKRLLPQEHWVDTGYVSAANMINSQTSQGIELLGPIPPDTSWQVQGSNRFALPTSAIDWESEPVTCSIALRAGVEGTISQVVRGSNLRRAPYIGLAKTHLHHEPCLQY
jgi:hypothetical protein